MAELTNYIEISLDRAYSASGPRQDRNTGYFVETQNGRLYSFYVDSNEDPCFSVSTNYGKTWAAGTVLKNCTCLGIAVWYDRWSNINADLIHVIYADDASDDLFYRNIDAANADNLSAETTVFAGSTVATPYISLTRTRSGNLIAVGTIDGGTELFHKKSTDVGANWVDISAVDGFEAAADIPILMPGWATDNHDCQMFYWDASADEVSVKFYDDSGNSWSETSLSASMVENVPFRNMSAVVDLTNSQNIVVAWSAHDAANADLRCWSVGADGTTVSEKTNVVLNSTDDQGCSGISISGTTWYCFYSGSSDGSQTMPTAVSVYYKYSTDQGVTWSAEYRLSKFTTSSLNILPVPIIYKKISIMHVISVLETKFYIKNDFPRSSYQLGM